jgi:predicted nucleic acid-binding protein
MADGVEQPGAEALADQALLGKDVAMDRERITEFHNRIDGVIYITDEAVREYSRLRVYLENRGTSISPNDTWIAAQDLVGRATAFCKQQRVFVSTRVALAELADCLSA